jgi:hypothetical protein
VLYSLMVPIGVLAGATVWLHKLAKD